MKPSDIKKSDLRRLFEASRVKPVEKLDKRTIDFRANAMIRFNYKKASKQNDTGRFYKRSEQSIAKHVS